MIPAGGVGTYCVLAEIRPLSGGLYGPPTCIRIIPAEGVMKTRLCIFLSVFFIFTVSSYAGGTADEQLRSREVVVYAYDSFVSEWGPGPELKKRFEARTGYTLTLVSCGDAAEVLSRAVREKKAPRADVLLGIDNTLAPQARVADILVPYKPGKAGEIIDAGLAFTEDWLLTPYDWGVFAIIFDTESGITPPQSLEDLAHSRFQGKFILMDPRMSTPGTGFLAWTMAVYGERYPEYWSRLKGNILTLAPGWDSGYGLFVSGEAPLVISYTTSPAYHLEYEQSRRFQALVFPEGHIRQIEGAGIVRNAENRDGAEAFIEFLVSTEAQEVLPVTQWMYPVDPSVPLPESFSASPRIDTVLSLPEDGMRTALTRVLDILSE